MLGTPTCCPEPSYPKVGITADQSGITSFATNRELFFKVFLKERGTFRPFAEKLRTENWNIPN